MILESKGILVSEKERNRWMWFVYVEEKRMDPLFDADSASAGRLYAVYMGRRMECMWLFLR